MQLEQARQDLDSVSQNISPRAYFQVNAAFLTSCIEKPYRDEPIVRIPPDVTSPKLMFPEICRSFTHKNTTFEIQYNP